MVAVPTLAPVPTGEAVSKGRWRADLDPLALPEAADLTAGQRKVLQGCLELFADNGYAGSSIRDIASVVGMQSASLYNHFASKEAMLVALVMLGHETHFDRVMTAVVDADSDPREQLRAMVHEHVMVHCEFPRLALVVTHEGRHAPKEVLPQVEAFRNRAASLMQQILRRGEEQSLFAIDGPRALTAIALASMGVDAARWYPYQSDIAATELAATYARLALRMVGAS